MPHFLCGCDQDPYLASKVICILFCLNKNRNNLIIHVFITKPQIGVTLEFFCGGNTKHNTNTYFFTLYIAHQSVNVAGKLYKFVLCLCFLRLIHDDCSIIYSQSLLHKVHLKHKQCFQNPNRFSYLFRTLGSLAHKDI